MIVNYRKILFTTSTLPSSDEDPVPAFVKDEAKWFKKTCPELDIHVLAPHNAYGATRKYQEHQLYKEYRFHYFWPNRLELLTGKGIQPALKKNKLLYFQLPFLFLFEFLATWRYTNKIKPDLIYAHWFTPQALTAAVVSKITGVPLVFDTQASDAIVLKHVPFSKKIVAWVCGVAKAYTVPSQQTLDKLLYFTTKSNREEILKKGTMVPYGTSNVDIDKRTLEAIQKKYNLEGKKIIYFIGRLVDRKGVDILIKAFKNIRKKEKNVILLIVGDGQDRDNLEKLSKDLGIGDYVTFTGFLTGEERYALLEASDVCAVPSINIGDQSEGLPVVFMEGITKGKPVVVSDATGAHEIVTDSIDAFVVKAGSVRDLEKGIIKALAVSKNDGEKFVEAVNKLAIKFQWPSIAQQRMEALGIVKNNTIL